jgi:hypothetical protein
MSNSALANALEDALHDISPTRPQAVVHRRKILDGIFGGSFEDPLTAIEKTSLEAGCSYACEEESAFDKFAIDELILIDPDRLVDELLVFKAHCQISSFCEYVGSYCND